MDCLSRISDGVASTSTTMNLSASFYTNSVYGEKARRGQQSNHGSYVYRQPPDGHEFPPIYKDAAYKMNNLPPKLHYAYITEFVNSDLEGKNSNKKAPAVAQKPKCVPPPLPKEPPPPPSPPKLPQAPAIVGCLTKNDTKGNLTSNNADNGVVFRRNEASKDSGEAKVSWWKSVENLLESSNKGKDHKTVSVKDRIAMFSSQPQQSDSPVSKAEPKPPPKQTFQHELFKKIDKSVSVENLSTMTKSRRGSLLPTEEPALRTNLESSQTTPKVSMKRRESFNGYTSNYPQSQLAGYRYPGNLSRSPQSPLETSRINNPIMSSLLESRRFGASKLKGLIIPETNASSYHHKNDKTSPKILSTDFATPESSRMHLMEPPWKSGSSNVPRYSPAFKRRSLQIATNKSPTRDALSDMIKFSMATSKPVEPIVPEKPSTVFSYQVGKSNASQLPDDTTKHEVKALNRLNNLLDNNSAPSEGVKHAINGFIKGALKENEFRIENVNSYSAKKMPLEVGSDSCFEEEEENSSSPAPSVQSDDTTSSLGSIGNGSRFACRTNSSDSALKSMSSSDQKSSYSATDDSWSDASSDSIENRPLDPDLKPRRLSQQRTVLKEQTNETDSVRNFKALAQTWQERSQSDPLKRAQSNENVLGKKSNVNGYFQRPQKAYHLSTETNIEESHSPKSWIKPSKSLDSLDEVHEANHGSKLKSHPDDDMSSKIRSSDCLVTGPMHKRLSSIGSSISEGDFDYNYISPITSPSDVYGSVSSLASTGSFVSSQETQQLLEEAYHSLEESGTPDHQVFIVVLQKDASRTTTGVSLSGGADYEQKDIIVSLYFMYLHHKGND